MSTAKEKDLNFFDYAEITRNLILYLKMYYKGLKQIENQ
jgi:hypothetical protein